MEQEITNYLISLVPAISAIISVVTAVLVGIAKVKGVVKNNDQTNELQKQELHEMRTQINTVLAENAELKKELKKTLYTLNNVEVTDNGEGK